MKRSIIVDRGIYQYEFLPDKIAVAKWDEPPASSMQWVHICPPSELLEPEFSKFYLEGDSNENICVCAYDGPNQVGQNV